MPDLPAHLVQSISTAPDDRGRWLDLASSLTGNGRNDEAVAVRVRTQRDKVQFEGAVDLVCLVVAEVS